MALPVSPQRHPPVLGAARIAAVVAVVAAAGWFLGARWMGPVAPDGALEANGTLEAVEATVSTQVLARVAQVLVNEGDAVVSDQPLVVLDSAIPELQRKLAPPAEQQLLSLQLEQYTLRSPRDGRVLRRAVEPGEVAVPGAGLLTVADSSRLELTVYVLQRDLGRVQAGAPVAVRAEALPGVGFGGTVTAIAEKAEFTPRNTQTPKDRLGLVFAVKVALSATDPRLKPGMSVTVRF
ncbi:MAG: efflux RND transporter periplasmic adaptor subunit [Chloroflexota bacterium]